ncbi:hypothetical protein Nepgr_032176 [Nepenthes gracilis]|uniref:Glycine-rich protein n=1 Tax=Nepenthes gracilis TaxID=150966 RepID=A0AAD3TI53_NEPGR|nr:hypothetical protein Nepgr_032176 [Nepenthes gracilis]
MKTTLPLITLLFIITLASLSGETRPEPDSGPSDSNPKTDSKSNKPHHHSSGASSGASSGGGFFGPGGGGGFNIPGFGGSWPGSGIYGGGYGAGYGGPTGGHSKGGIVRSSVVCKEKGPCYLKKLTCPAKCFTSFSSSGKGYGGGGGGGGCTVDCKKKCTAYC